MGFWDFIAPDFESFRETLLPVVPEAVLIGPVVLSDDDFIALAWANPGSGAGLALRTYYAASTFQVARPVADAIWGQLQQQASAGAFGAGGGFGGSFDWKAVPNMAQLIIPGAFRVAIEAESGGQVVTNVVGVSNGGGTAQGAAEAVQTAWKIANGPLVRLTSLYQLTGFRALELGSANGGIAFVGDNTLGGSTTTPNKATNAACALIKWNGGTRSRSSRGRLYHGPLREVDCNGDGRTLEATTRTNLETAYAAFRASLSASGYPLVVLSPTLNQAFPVTSSSVELVLATQRRRIRS